MGIFDKLFGKKKQDTASADDHLRAAYTLWQDKKLKDAIKECKAVIEVNPNYAVAHCMLADIYKDQNELDDAIKAYKDALQFDPNYALARSNLGMVYSLQGNDEAAIREWEETLRRGVDSVIIRRNTEDWLKEAKALRDGRKKQIGDVDNAVSSYMRELGQVRCI